MSERDAGMEFRGTEYEPLPVLPDRTRSDIARQWWREYRGGADDRGVIVADFGRLADTIHAMEQEAAAIPPVTGGEMPQLAMPWWVLRRSDGKVWHSLFATSEEAEQMRTAPGPSAFVKPHELVTCRLAVVEVVEPEPEPEDSWEKLASDALIQLHSGHPAVALLRDRRAALLDRDSAKAVGR